MSSGHRWPVLHHAANAVGLAFRLVPYRHRFGAVRCLAFVLHPLIRRTVMCRSQVAMGLDTSREVTLYIVLRFLTRTGNAFPIPFIQHGQEVLERALAERNGGLLVTSLHATLSIAMFRLLYDLEVDPIVIEATPHPLIGRGKAYGHALVPDAMMLTRARSHLRKGDVVAAFPDRAEATRRTRQIQLPAGPINVSLALFEVARKTGAKVIMCCGRTNRAFELELVWADVDNQDDARLLAGIERFFGAELPSSRAIGAGGAAGGWTDPAKGR